MAYLYNYSFFISRVNIFFTSGSIILSYNHHPTKNQWKKPKSKSPNYNKNSLNFVKSVSPKILQKKKRIKENNNKTEKESSKYIPARPAKLLHINFAMTQVFINQTKHGSAIFVNIPRSKPTNNNVSFANAKERC